MIDLVNNLINFSSNNFHTLSYWIVFFAALLETIIIIGLFLPGSTVVLILGA
ncbi:MAG TPA: DedA family protein, partial [Candidatus Moranbacteria bacterium]|nr:DedA family protein [Candidatus Moranbacteria bacterium]